MPSITPEQKNHLLAALQAGDLKHFFSDLHPVLLSLRHVIQAAGEPIEHVYFINEGVASVLTTMANGATIEVGMIGIEGVVGVSAVLGAEVSVQQIVIQIPGNALRMSAARCRVAFAQSAEVRRVMLRFADAMLNLSAQTAACNRLHSIEQRCARWLLMAYARHTSNIIPMTHEFLSSMLGVRRVGVTETAGELQRSGSDPLPARQGHDRRPRGPRKRCLRVLRAGPRQLQSAALSASLCIIFAKFCPVPDRIILTSRHSFEP